MCDKSMTDTERIEYLEGKVQGLDRLSQVLIETTQSLWPDIATGMEWRVAFRTQLVDLLAGLEEGDTIVTLRGQGQRDALAEFESKFFSR